MINFIDSAAARSLIEGMARDLAMVARSRRAAWLEAFREATVSEMPDEVVDALVEMVCLRVAELEGGHATLSTPH